MELEQVAGNREVRTPRSLNIFSRPGHAERPFERTLHPALTGPAGQQKGSINIKQNDLHLQLPLSFSDPS
jgi:hypothetical protein